MRTPRSEEIATDRRRRKPDTLDRVNGQKLELPPELANAPDRDQWYYYWANDSGSRIYDLTVNDDYDPVTLSAAEATDKDTVKRPVGRNDDGSAVYAHLLRKPMEFHLEDRRAKDGRLKEQEKLAITRPGDVPTEHASDAGHIYTSKSNSIKQGGFTP